MFKNALNSFRSLFLVLFFLCLCLLTEGSADDLRSRRVLVSVAPHKFMVEKIAGDTLTVDLMVPAGASAHTFEPSPKQMLAAGKADLWFYIGEGFESRAMASLSAHNPRMQMVDLRKNLDMISGGCACRHHRNYESSLDLHFSAEPPHG